MEYLESYQMVENPYAYDDAPVGECPECRELLFDENEVGHNGDIINPHYIFQCPKCLQEFYDNELEDFRYYAHPRYYNKEYYECNYDDEF